ncbi:POM121-like protein 2 [Meles meles]|uniref:POM121-like protein 2 n=1 Tax=Meles meles TaxID=9662 RepID=UPI001E6A0522|nr:POM121-like protein 2 [Meles meles]
MGSYLGRPGSQPSSPAQARTDSTERPRNRRPAQPLHQVHRLPPVHRAHPALRHRPARRPPNPDPASPIAWAVHEAWRRFPMERSQNSIVGPLPSDWWDSYLPRTLWSLRHPRAAGSPVTIKIAPPERRALPSTSPAEDTDSAGSSPSEKPPDPCAKETVLRALRECKKGRVRFDEPLFPEGSHSERRSPDTPASAFKPLVKHGALTSFAPRPGPLKRSRKPWSSDHSLTKRPSCSSLCSSASTHPGGLLSSRRNAIASSYSSSRTFSELWKRGGPRVSLQTPEWPVKKTEKGHQAHSPVSLEPDGSPEASGSSGLLSGPGDLLAPTPPPQLGDADPGEDMALGEKGGLQGSNKAGEETTDLTTDSVSETCSALQPSLPLALPSAGPAPTPGPNPQLESLTETQESPLALPPAMGEAVGVAPPALKEGGPLSSQGCSQSEPLTGTSSDSRPMSDFILLTSVSPTSPATDATWPPPSSQAEGTAVSPAVLPGLSPLSGMSSPAPHLPASAPPEATASADPTSHPMLGLPPKSEIGVSSYSTTSMATTTSSSIPTPTSKPMLGGIGPLKALPTIAPFSFEQTSPLASPASTHLLHGPVKALSGIMATTPKDHSFMPPLDVGAVNVTGALGNTHSTPSTSHSFLLGAACAFRASFTPTPSFLFPAHPRTTVPTVHTVTIFSQVLSSAVQISPSPSTAFLRGVGCPLSASALVASPQASLPSSSSGPISAFGSPSGAGSGPLFPLSPGATLERALGATGGQKQGAPQPALGPSLSSPFIFGNSAAAFPTATPAPAQPALSSPAKSPSGGLTALASACRLPAGIRPKFGSTAAGVPFGQASRTGSGVVAQTHQNVARGSVFGSTAPPPFAFGGLVTPMDCGDSGVSGTGRDMSSNPGAFSIGGVPSGTPGTISRFGKGWSQNSPRLTSQSTPFVLGRASISAGKSMFGGPCVAPFAQSTPIPRPVMTSSSFNFGMPSPPTQGCARRGTFRSPASSFSIGAKSKNPKNRDQGHSRRHHAHRK